MKLDRDYIMWNSFFILRELLFLSYCCCAGYGVVVVFVVVVTWWCCDDVTWCCDDVTWGLDAVTLDSTADYLDTQIPRDLSLSSSKRLSHLQKNMTSREDDLTSRSTF